METNKTPDTETAETAVDTQPDKSKKTGNEQPTSSGKATKPKKKDEQGLKKLQQENNQLQKELDDTKDMYQRMLAEYANYKRRTEQEKEQLSSFVKAETLKALLPALDNLERSIEAPPGDEYKKGVDMTIRQLIELLESQGLESINPKGDSFDPLVHNAVMREDAEGEKSDIVTEVFQKGYKLGDRVLRPAMVKVAN